jgi:hypothetical protein
MNDPEVTMSNVLSNTKLIALRRLSRQQAMLSRS